jgi:hypothetical protein
MSGEAARCFDCQIMQHPRRHPRRQSVGIGKKSLSVGDSRKYIRRRMDQLSQTADEVACDVAQTSQSSATADTALGWYQNRTIEYLEA